MKQIPLTQGKFTIVDDEDYEELSKHKWCVKKGLNTYYARRWAYLGGGKSEHIRMHRLLLNPKNDEEIDHKDGNGLNNQKNNLRICTRQQNMANRQPQKGSSSQYKGVSWDKIRGGWTAQIKISSKIIRLGFYDDEEEAARAYDKKAVQLHGEFARLNIKA